MSLTDKDIFRMDIQLDENDRRPRSTMLFGYLALSLCAGVTIWGVIFSVSIVNYGLAPGDTISAAFGIKQPIDDPMIVARESDLSLIEPAAGHAHGCE